MNLEPRTLGCAGTSLGRHREIEIGRERERAVEDSKCTILTVTTKAVTWRPRNKSVAADTNTTFQCNPSKNTHTFD